MSHVTRTSLSRSKGQGHQATLVGCTGRPTWTYSNGDLSIRVHDIYHVTTCRPGEAYRGGRPPTACYTYIKILLFACGKINIILLLPYYFDVVFRVFITLYSLALLLSTLPGYQQILFP